METIRNYLESMFRGLPLTNKVMRAKSELLQMMEDKYTELIKDGKTENEAVGEVIQNFGNLEDIAEDLGIKDIINQSKYTEVKRRKLSFDELSEYLVQKKRSIIFKALGIALCIFCVAFNMICDAIRLPSFFGPSLMFISAGVGIVFISLSRSYIERWAFLKDEPCSIDSVSIDYLKKKARDFTSTYTVLSSIGILLCIFCFVPEIVFDEIDIRFIQELGGVGLFSFIATGVFLLVYARKMKKTFINLLGTNNKIDFDKKMENDMIENKTAKAILDVYWTIITCIYLSISFLTFDWEITWIIWPVAAIAKTIIKAIFINQKAEDKKAQEED